MSAHPKGHFVGYSTPHNHIPIQTKAGRGLCDKNLCEGQEQLVECQCQGDTHPSHPRATGHPAGMTSNISSIQPGNHQHRCHHSLSSIFRCFRVFLTGVSWIFYINKKIIKKISTWFRNVSFDLHPFVGRYCLLGLGRVIAVRVQVVWTP